MAGTQKTGLVARAALQLGSPHADRDDRRFSPRNSRISRDEVALRAVTARQF
jgi:hypothetical protein